MICPVFLDWIVVLEFKDKVVDTPFIMLRYAIRFIIEVFF